MFNYTYVFLVFKFSIVCLYVNGGGSLKTHVVNYILRFNIYVLPNDISLVVFYYV
jgi:hypothetical protein